ncbi:substrate-binding periplasmic protein [Maridesulfovibrio frigidus]|uniref:substrate-binding periplasmic protein n=1 Tax=Maridesulfovibrio frigidus TaxID=340956 RepID=UPI0004E0FFB8|nr:transporter substrate-binding domain-containing protein [Maridesulfovibrio frigidus]
MKKNIFLSALFAILLTLCKPAYAEDYLVFATQDFPPFSYLVNGEVKGPGADIINSVCNKMSKKIELQLFAWQQAQDMAEKGEVQALFFVGKNKQRETWLDFSPPIIQVEYGFFECTYSPINYENIHSLQDLTVGAYGPSNTSIELKKIAQKLESRIDVSIMPDDSALFKKLSKSKVDAVYSNKDVGSAMIHKLALDNIQYAGTDKTLKYYIAFSKKHTPTAFVKEFNKALREMKKSGELKKILQEYGMTVAN